jgi:hypothetical protein
MISFSFAQNPIPNAGFEEWTDGTPNNWVTLDIPGFYDAVTHSDIARTGSSAVKGEVVEFYGAGAPPYLASDTGYFGISQNYTRLTGYYQFSNNGDDVLWALVQFLDAQHTLVAAGDAEFGQTTGGYTQFAVDLNYLSENGEPAAQAIIAFSIIPSSESQSDSLTIGSYFLIDDLAFDNVSDIADGSFGASPRTYQLAQNYPNPFNPSTTINFSVPQSGKVSLSIFNSIGQEVQALVDDEMAAGDHQVTFNAENLPSGIYFYKMEAGNFLDVKKMVLIK